MTTIPTKLDYTTSWMNATQQELTGTFSDKFSLEVVDKLEKAGFVHDLEMSFGDNDELINIVNEAGKKILGSEDFDFGLARIMARELSFEGIYRPAK